MRYVISLPVLFISCFIIGCEERPTGPKGSGIEIQNYSDSNVLPNGLRRVIGSIEDAEITCFIGSPDAKNPAMYRLTFPEKQNANLLNAVGHAFLLQDNANNFVRLFQAIQKSEDFKDKLDARFFVPHDSPIGKRITSEVIDWIDDRKQALPAVPWLLLFVETSAGAYAVDTSKIRYLIEDPNVGKVMQVSRTRLEGDSRKPFESAGIELPIINKNN